MKTNILANAVIGTSMALLLLVAGISIALAKDLQAQTNWGAANVSSPPPSERGIDAIRGKEDTGSANTSEKVLYKYKKGPGYDRTKKYGDDVGPNPQPAPPKDTKAPPKKDLGEAAGLNPQPLPPTGMGGTVE